MSGTTGVNSASTVDVLFDSSGLTAGVYTGTLCVNSNDPLTPIVTVPLTMTVIAANAPVAVNDAYHTMQDVALTVTAPGVLANDSDDDGDLLTAVLNTVPSNGSLSLNSDGSFTYTPTTGFLGTDSFTYRANDGVQNSNVATVTIAVKSGELYLPVIIKSGSTQAKMRTSEAAAASHDGWAFATLAALPVMLGMIPPYRRRHGRFNK
jgi:VCBS repeat-containing protein